MGEHLNGLVKDTVKLATTTATTTKNNVHIGRRDAAFLTLTLTKLSIPYR